MTVPTTASATRSQPRAHGRENPPVNPVRAAHAEFVIALAAHPPSRIPLFPDAADLEDRADHLKLVLKALTAYLAALLDDAAQNIPGGLDLGQIDALLF
jgi:hypothetical protein